MTAEASTYRWNTSAATEAYDAAAPVIHPYYEKIQDEILDLLLSTTNSSFSNNSLVLVDVGGGSGRLAERVLERFNGAVVTVVDQSEPFLALAERRLARFAPWVTFVQSRLQDDWVAKLPARPDVIVSTSAIHHLVPEEKQTLYKQCFEALVPGGLFINGDEFRPADDAELLALYKEWSAHMHAAIDDGRIPDSFRTTLELWHDRNITRFGEPKESGDDCLETIDAQVEYLQLAGFADVEVTWSSRLWAVLVGRT